MHSRIAEIEAIPVRMPLSRVFVGSNYRMTHRVTVVTRITTEDGIRGEIYNGDEDADLAEIVSMIRMKIKPLILNEDVFDVGGIWARMEPLTHDILADRKIALNAMACVDSAIHDAIGKTLKLPLLQLWGGGKRTLPVMVIGGYYTEGKDVDEKAIVEDIESYKELGANACKFKVGGKSPDIDAARARIARKAAGDDFVLSVDANQGWTRKEALEFASGVRDLNIRWFEEPCRWSYDRDGMRDVRLMSGIPVAAGQSEDSAAKCIDLMMSASIDVCNFDSSWSGGATAWKQVAGAAAALGFDMAHHEEPQVSAHLLGWAPTGTFLEVFHPDRDPMFYTMIQDRNPFIDGYYEVPSGPGFGVNLDHDIIEKYRVDS